MISSRDLISPRLISPRLTSSHLNSLTHSLTHSLTLTHSLASLTHQTLTHSGVRAGTGEFCSPNTNMVYTGQWANDNINGEGTLTVGKAKFVGQFVDGVFVKVWQKQTP
jgi:hypothetical protein